MANNVFFLFLVSFVMFDFLSSVTEARHPFMMTDGGSKNEKWVARTMSGRRMLPDDTSCVGHPCVTDCPPPVGNEFPCVCSNIYKGSKQPFHCVSDDGDDTSSSDSDSSSGDVHETLIPLRVGPCYDPCPNGACEDNENCICSSEHDPIYPYCVPRFVELGSDYSPSDGEHEDDDKMSINDDSSSKYGGTCYDPCPTGACQDDANCICSSEYDPKAPFCVPRFKELGSDHSRSDDEQEKDLTDMSISDDSFPDDESSTNYGGSQSGDVDMGDSSDVYMSESSDTG